MAEVTFWPEVAAIWFSVGTAEFAATGEYVWGICWSVYKAIQPSLLLPAFLLLASCSHQKTIHADELRSDLTVAASMAAETETLIDYVVQDRATKNYARGHIQYLAEEAKRTAKELHQASPEPSLAQKFIECRKQVDLLADELGAASRSMERHDALLASRQKIAELGKTLDEAKASL